MVLGHLVRLFKEGFRGHGKEFGGIRGAVMVHHAVLLVDGVVAQVVEIARQHRGPAAVARHAGQIRRAIRGARFTVELVGKFMQHDIVPIGPVGRTALHVVPGQHHSAIAPGFAQ
ncbi:hypothetical protein D3C81_1519860 [compost metagenome]